MKVFILLIPLFACSQAAEQLLGPSDHQAGEEDFHPCHEDDALSCEVVTVNFAALEVDDEISLPDGHVLQRGDEEEIMEGVFSHTFTDAAGSEATFTTVDGRAFGNANLVNGSDWVLEDCNNFPGCHVWKEEDMETFNKKEDEALEMPSGGSRSLSRADFTALLKQGETDQTTITTYSVKFYYTREFAAATDDIPLYVAQVVAETNQGYINSKIPVRMVAHCIEAAEMNDNPSGSKMINEFRQLKGSLSELLGSADHAALLFIDSNICGNAYLRGWWGSSVSTSAKGCALGYYTMGHELGHSQGAKHDKYDGKNTWRSYGLGFHVQPAGLDGSGYRTIMAYRRSGHTRKINYWSAKDPSIMFRGQYPTGDKKADNQRLLIETRFAFSAIGDESESCGGGSLTTTLPTTTMMPAPTGMGGDSDWAFCSKKNRCSEGQGDCDANSHCKAGLLCGRRNCQEWHPTAHPKADCCVVDPAPKKACSMKKPCSEGTGHCRNDKQCKGRLVCGKKNCRDWHPTARKNSNCCTTPAGSGDAGR